MEDVTPEAIVVSVAERGKVRGVPFFTVEAQMYVPAHKYSDSIFRVKLLEPIALADEYLMEHGKFSFDTLKEVKEKERFKISISPATSTA